MRASHRTTSVAADRTGNQLGELARDGHCGDSRRLDADVQGVPGGALQGTETAR
jgi:hypothetical protein